MTSSSKVARSAEGNLQPSQLSVRDRARRALRSFVREESAPSLDENKEDVGDFEEEDVLDACRVLHQEALLLYHTERVRDILRQDPLKVLFVPEPTQTFEDGDSADKDKSQAPTSSAQDRASRRRRQLLGPVFRTAEVMDFDQAVTRDGYVRIDATVRLFATHASANKPSKRRKGRSASKDDATRYRRVSASTDDDRFVELRFAYERTANTTGGDVSSPESSSSPTYVSYHIDYCGCSSSNDDAKRKGVAAASALVGPRQRLLWVNVVAPLGTPSPHGSQLYDDDEEDDDSALWSDVESEDANDNKTGAASGTAMSPAHKRRKRCQPDCPCDGEDKFLPKTSNATANNESEAEEVDDDPIVTAKDVFTAGVDPDILQQLQCELGLDDPALSEDDSAAIFVLMSFPFYEHEWDLVGYVLDAVFGPDKDDDDDEEDEEEHVGE